MKKPVYRADGKIHSVFEIRKDAWANSLSGLGGASDKSQFNQYQYTKYISDEVLANTYVGDGWARKIVDAPADDMTRAGISIEGDEVEKYKDVLRRISAFSEINIAVKWTRLYRGALVIVGTTNSGELNEPLVRASAITNLMVVPPSRVTILAQDIVTDPRSPYFNDVEMFRVLTRSGQVLEVHASRCLVFKGDRVPDDAPTIDWQYVYWGISALQSIYEKLGVYSGMEQHIATLLMEMIVGIYKFNNLAELLAQNDRKSIQDRIEIINQTKSMINAIFLGEGEEFNRNTASVAGLAELWDRMMMMLSGVSGIPVTRLFGRSPAGMNSTGESDLTNYYDMVRADQENWLRWPINKLLGIIALTLGGKKEAPTFSFNNPWEPTQKELIEMRYKQAQQDEIYINSGVLSPEDVTNSRFRGGYSFETELVDEVE